MNREKEIEQLFELARANWEQSFESSRSYALRALKKAEELGSVKLIASAYNILSVAYFYIGDYEQALTYGEKALDCIRNICDPTLTPSIHNNIGMVFFRQERMEECLNHYLKSLYYAVRNDNPNQIAVSMCNLGGAFWQADSIKFDVSRIDALVEFKKAIGSEIKVDDPIAELVRQFHELDNRELGYRFFGRAMHVIKDHSSNPRLYVNLLINLGLWNCTEGNHEEAAQYYRKAGEMAKTLNMPVLLSTVYLNQADNEIQMGETEQALEHTRQAVISAHAMKNDPDVATGMRMLSEIYVELGDYPRALSSHRVFSKITQKGLNEQCKKEIAQIKSRYEVRIKDLQLENDRLVQVLSNYKNRMQD